MNDQCAETPLLELARSVPIELRGEWENQWDDDGTPTGHSMAPVGNYVHHLADEIERLQSQLDSRDEVLEATKDILEQTRRERDGLLLRLDSAQATLDRYRNEVEQAGKAVLEQVREKRELLLKLSSLLHTIQYNCGRLDPRRVTVDDQCRACGITKGYWDERNCPVALAEPSRETAIAAYKPHDLDEPLQIRDVAAVCDRAPDKQRR